MAFFDGFHSKQHCDIIFFVKECQSSSNYPLKYYILRHILPLHLLVVLSRMALVDTIFP